MGEHEAVEGLAGDGEYHAVGGLGPGDQVLQVGNGRLGAGEDGGIVPADEDIVPFPVPVGLPAIPAAGVADHLQHRRQPPGVVGVALSHHKAGALPQKGVGIRLGVNEQMPCGVEGEEIEQVVGVQLAPVGRGHDVISLPSRFVKHVGDHAVVHRHEADLVDLVVAGVPAPGAQLHAQGLHPLAEGGASSLGPPRGQEGQLHEHDVLHARLYQLRRVVGRGAPGVDAHLHGGIFRAELVGQEPREGQDALHIGEVARVEEVGDHPIRIGRHIGVDIVVFVEGRPHAGILPGGLCEIGVSVGHRLVGPAVAREVGRPHPQGKGHAPLVKLVCKDLVAVVDGLPRAARPPRRRNIRDLRPRKAAGAEHLGVVGQLAVGQGGEVGQQGCGHVADIATVVVGLPSAYGGLPTGDPRGRFGVGHSGSLLMLRRNAV